MKRSALSSFLRKGKASVLAQLAPHALEYVVHADFLAAATQASQCCVARHVDDGAAAQFKFAGQRIERAIRCQPARRCEGALPQPQARGVARHRTRGAGSDPAFVHDLNIGRADPQKVALHTATSLTRSDGLAFIALAERFSLKTMPLDYPLPLIQSDSQEYETRGYRHAAPER